jgi:hypothetical protein
MDVGGTVVLPVHVDGDTVKLGNAGHRCKLLTGSNTFRSRRCWPMKPPVTRAGPRRLVLRATTEGEIDPEPGGLVIELIESSAAQSDKPSVEPGPYRVFSYDAVFGKWACSQVRNRGWGYQQRQCAVE